MLVTAILGLLAPLAAYTSYYFIFAILVAQVVINLHFLQLIFMQGLCEGVTYPSLNPHISRWVPSQERSRLRCSMIVKQSKLIYELFLRTIGRTQVPVCLLLQVYIFCFPWRDSWDRSDAAFVWNSP